MAPPLSGPVTPEPGERQPLGEVLTERGDRWLVSSWSAALRTRRSRGHPRSLAAVLRRLLGREPETVIPVYYNRRWRGALSKALQR